MRPGDSEWTHVGYLREAYHGEPYATRVLVPEAFAANEAVPIPAETLRARLPDVLAAVEKRHTTIYQDSPEAIATYQQAYADFVDLAARKESETGEPVLILVS